MKVIVTKFATTSGVFVAEAETSHDARMVSVNGRCFHKPHWHTSSAEAALQVGRVFAAKRRSLLRAVEALDERLKTATEAARRAGLK